MTILVALLLCCLTSVWRFADGRSQSDLAPQDIQWLYRPKHSNVYAVALVLSAGLWGLDLNSSHKALEGYFAAHGPMIFPTLVTCWLLVKGMPGFDRWLPHVNSKGKRLSGMLIGYALPPALCAAAWTLLFGPSLACLALLLSGFVPCVTYVLASQLEERRKNLEYPSGGQFLIRGRWWSGEELGRVSMSALLFPIPLL